MALTRSDKFIIAGAITLALAVVLGLAIWKKPYLFTGGAPTPPAAETPLAENKAQAPPAEQAAEPAADSAAQGAQAVQKSAVAPQTAAAPEAAPPIPEPPTQERAPEPVTAPPASTAAAPSASGEAAPDGQAIFKGDEALDAMFAEMSKPEPGPQAEAPAKPEAGGETPGAPVSSDKETPSGTALDAPQASMNATDAPAPAAPPVPKDKPAKDVAPQAEKPQKPGKSAKPETPAMAKADSMDAAKPKPQKPAAQKAAPARGRIVSVVPSSSAGEFTLAITASAPIAGYQKFFLDNPPRVVFDIEGAWNYTGPLTLSGKGPLVGSVRLGKHPGMFRVVVDLLPDAEMRLRAAPEAVRTQNGLTLRIR